MPLLNARGLSKAYGPQTILDEANLVIQPGERIGLVGVNGSGKSTLARILAGLDTPDTGDVVLQRDITVSYLSQQPELEPGKRVMEVVLGGLQRWTAAKQRFDAASEELDQAGQAEPARLDQLVAQQSTAAAEVERLGGWDVSFRARSILDNLHVSQVDSPVGQLSGGEQRRVALARILVGQPHVALLDEPTNHLDLTTIEWLETYLRDQFSGALLLITHDRTLIDCVAQRTLELERGVLRSYDGGYVAFLEAKAERLSQEARAEANRQRFVRRELQWLRRQPKARTGKQKARIQRAQSAMAVDAPSAAKELRLQLAAPRSSKRVLLLEELTLQLGNKQLVSGLDLLVTRGERIGVLGPNGCGKTTLLRAITGDLEPTQGRVWRSGNAAVAYLSQQRDDLDDNASVIEAVADGQRKVTVGEHAVDVEAYLARFLFPTGRTDQPVRSLSGGERTRVALARMLCRPANLVILDEPTNDLDVPTIAAVEQLIVEQTTTAIVVTHDRWFLDRVATSLLVFEGEGQVVRYEGNFSMYRRLVATKTTAEKPTAPVSAKAAPTPKRPSALTYGEKIELEGLLDKVAEAEERVTQLEAQLTDPAIYGDHNRVTALSNEIGEARTSAATLLARWEELENKREQS